MLLHEARQLMLFQGVVEPPDVPAEDYHMCVGEGRTLPPLPRDELLLLPGLLTKPAKTTPRSTLLVDAPARAVSWMIVAPEDRAAGVVLPS